MPGRTLYDLAERRRLGLAQALIGNPDVLLLDEPVAALDPVARAELLGIVGELRDRVTMRPVEPGSRTRRDGLRPRRRPGRAGGSSWRRGSMPCSAASRGRGTIIALERPAGLALAGLVARLRVEPWVRSVEVDGHVPPRVRPDDVASAARELLPSVVATGLPIASFRRERPTLADAIGELAGRRSRAGGTGTAP